MRAIVCTTYGPPDNLRLEDVPKPIPKPNQVLIKVHAAGVNAGDWHAMRGEPRFARVFLGWFKPKYPILGVDVAGRVEAVGSDVTEYKPGDEVYADLSPSGYGGYAEWVCADAKTVAPKPANVTFEQAAAIPTSAVTALQGLRDHGSIAAGKRVLINGASGGVGTFAVQIAKAFGAEVTAVCSSRNLELVRSLGADHVIDYTKENFTKSGIQYDLILAANGYHPIADYKRALSPNGAYVMAGGEMKQFAEVVFRGPWHSMTSSKKMSNFLMKPNKDDLLFMNTLLEAGSVVPVIDKVYSLPEVPDAIRHMEEKHASGKLVIKVEKEA